MRGTKAKAIRKRTAQEIEMCLPLFKKMGKKLIHLNDRQAYQMMKREYKSGNKQVARKL